MNDGTPGLEVGFNISFGGSFEEIQRLQRLIESTEFKTLVSASKIERATNDMVNLGGATAQVTAFSNVATRELRAVARETAQVELAGEALIRQLDREAASLGRTRDEMRDAKVESIALAAEKNKNTDLADRLLTAARGRQAAAENAAQMASEAAGRAAVEAAQQRAVAESLVIAQLRERAQIEAALERTTGIGRTRAIDNGASFSALNAKAADDEARAIAGAGAAAAKAAREHEALAAAVRGSHAAQLADADAAERLRMATDPLYAATKRLNDEIAESTRLYHVGATAPAEYARQQDMLAGRLRDVTAAHDTATGATGKLGRAAKLSRGDMLNLGYQINDVVVSLASGQKPFMVFAQQGAQIGQIAASSGVGLRGMAAAVGALAVPFLPVIAAVAVAAGGFLLFDRAISKGIDTKAMIDGLGLTRDEIKRLENTTVSTGDVITGTFQVVAKRVGIDLSTMGKVFGSLMDFMTTAGRDTLAGLYAGFAGTFKAIGTIMRAGFTGMGPGQIMTEIGKGYEASFNNARKSLTMFGADVTKQVASNKLADLTKQANELKLDRAVKKPATDRTAERLARENEAIEAQIRNLYKLADAYGVSGAAALIDEARVKAESDAIKKRGDIEMFVDRQVRLAIAERVKAAAQSAAAMREQADAQAEINGMVAAGTVPFERAAELLQQRIAELPLLAAIEAAQQRGLKTEAEAATKALEAQRNAQKDKDASTMGARFVAADSAADQRLADLREELRLVGATDAARIRALATLKAQREAQALFPDALENQNTYVRKQVEIAVATADVAAATREWNDALSYNADQWDLIAQNVQDGARGMADAFGSVGQAIGDMASIYADYRAQEERARVEHKQALDLAQSAGAKERENSKYMLATSTRQIGAYGDMTRAAKGFFKEKSAAYKAFETAERVFRAFEFAMSVRAMVQDVAETISSVANSGARAVAAGAEGVATQAKLPFPANIAAMAATAGALVAAGISVLGSGGGGGGPSVPTAEDIQKGQGVGSVLGDSAAKSSSLGNSLELMLKNANKDLEYSSEMVKSLRAIESNLGNLASLVAREMDVGGGLDASKLALGTNSGGGLLGIGGLFSKQITREMNDAGLKFDGGSVASIIADGITANLYNEILTTTKKSGFLGIGGSTKTTVETMQTGADASLTGEVRLLVSSMRDAIVSAAGTIGIDSAGAMLDAFQIDIGRISFKDLTSDQIEAELAAVFSRVGDDMAGAVAGGFSQFQKVGEGLFETLMRLAKEYQTIDVTLRSIGLTFGDVGLASVGARTALIELFGGLDAFTEQSGYFRENFLSEAEQMAPIIAAVTAEMTRLSLAGVDTKDEFKNVVLGLDLSTEAGQAMYAALMAVAPAFAKATEYTASLNGELRETAKTAEQLASIAKQRRSLEIALMEATGDATGALAAKRTDELAALDETLRALQEQVWAAQDATAANAELAKAQMAAAELARTRRGLEIQLMDAQGNAAAALEAKRADELAALEPTLRALQSQIWAAMDAAAANAALADAQKSAADAATQAAEQIAAAQAQIAQQRASLEVQLLRATGQDFAARDMERGIAVNSLDPSLRALQVQVWAAEDAATAAAAAQADLNRQQEAAAQIAQAAAQAAQEQQRAAEELRRSRLNLETQLLDLLGDAAGATALRRQEELAALDASLRPLQQAIYAQQDLAAAVEASAKRVGTARDRLTASYKRESDALSATIDRFKGFGDSLREFRDSLGVGDAAVGDAYRVAQGLFVDASARAAIGDAGALADLEGISKDFLTASRDRASSMLDYQRDVARVASSVDRAIGATSEAVDYAQAQLDALNHSVAGLIEINESVVSVHDAILMLRAEMIGGVPDVATLAPSTAFVPTSQTMQVNTRELERRVDGLSARMEVQNTTIAENTGKMARFMDRWDGGGLLVRTEEDTPLHVTDMTVATPTPDPTPTISNTLGSSTLPAGAVAGFAERAQTIATRSAAIDARLAALEG